ncbi:MAG: DUF4007 family protein [Gammaproteobacteria bacterium]|nr:DUF4007 family protein [Gammaproteobacteria bacterium]
MTRFGEVRVQPFDPAKVAFGRHETFPLRYAWLPKGYQALAECSTCFESDSATVELGVGKNMVSAIRYWLHATGMSAPAQRGYDVTPLGRRLLGADGWDPYLEDEATLWLIHWLLCTTPAIATTWWWFFNCFHKAEFTSKEATDALTAFARERTQSRNSVATLKQDELVLLRMYSPARKTTRTPLEESLDSPMTSLGLMSYQPEGRRYSSTPDARDSLPAAVVAFAPAEVFEASGTNTIRIDELLYSRSNLAALGSVFRLTESSFIAHVERVVQALPECFELRETAGLNQLYLLQAVPPLFVLSGYYDSDAMGAAA